MPTTIQVEPAVRDRLRAYGTAGMTYNDILLRLMDEVDRQAFVARIRREMDDVRDWVDLDEA
jgi:hypothetical protein